MSEIVIPIILFSSLLVMGFIVVRKIPVLVELKPEEIKPVYWNKFKEKVKSNGFFKFFSGEILLQKILSKFRILTLKTENKTACWLARLRQKNKSKFSEDYWKKIRRKK